MPRANAAFEDVERFKCRRGRERHYALPPVMIGASATAGFPKTTGAKMFWTDEKKVRLITPEEGESEPLGLE